MQFYLFIYFILFLHKLVILHQESSFFNFFCKNLTKLGSNKIHIRPNKKTQNFNLPKEQNYSNPTKHFQIPTVTIIIGQKPKLVKFIKVLQATTTFQQL